MNREFKKNNNEKINCGKKSCKNKSYLKKNPVDMNQSGEHE